MLERYGLLVLALRRKVDLPRGAFESAGIVLGSLGRPDPQRRLVCNTPTCSPRGMAFWCHRASCRRPGFLYIPSWANNLLCFPNISLSFPSVGRSFETFFFFEKGEKKTLSPPPPPPLFFFLFFPRQILVKFSQSTYI